MASADRRGRSACGPPGHSTVAFLAGGVSKKMVFSGGAAAVAGLPAASAEDLASSQAPAARVAWEAYMESAAKAVSALAVAVPQAHESSSRDEARAARACVMSSRIGCAASWTASRSTRSRGSRPRPVQAAQGAALIADGLSGGAAKALVERLDIRGPVAPCSIICSWSLARMPAHESASVNRDVPGSGFHVPGSMPPNAERRTPNAERRTVNLNMNVEPGTRTLKRSESRPRAGVSTRAAAESAAKAGFDVTAIDAFGDLDQHPAVKSLVLPHDDRAPFTAQAAAEACATSPRMRWSICRRSRITPERSTRWRPALRSALRTGPSTALTAGRALWGNPPDVIRRVRDPSCWPACFARRGLLFLTRVDVAPDLAGTKEWLVKPFRSGGGHG